MAWCFTRYRPGPTGGGTAAASRSAQSTADRVKLGALTIDVAAAHEGSTYTTTVTRHGVVKLRIGAVLPDGATIASATLNGSPVKLKQVQTTRGLEATVLAPSGQRRTTLVITIAP